MIMVLIFQGAIPLTAFKLLSGGDIWTYICCYLFIRFIYSYMWALALLDQEPRRESFQASLDALVECRDKFRFQEDRVHSDCDTLEKQIEVVREQRQKSFIQLAQKTEEQKKQLEKIKWAFCYTPQLTFQDKNYFLLVFLA